MYNSKIVHVTRPNFYKILKEEYLLGQTFFGTFFCEKHGKNSAGAKKIVFLFFLIDKNTFYRIENISI